MVVIDWTGLQLSDPRFDLAWTLMLISAYQGSQWRQSFLEAYERHAGELLENLEFFDVAACTRRLYSIAVRSLQVPRKWVCVLVQRRRCKTKLSPPEQSMIVFSV
jgi:aminoglycoside phosphotransferase (APT) family kinase protein